MQAMTCNLFYKENMYVKGNVCSIYSCLYQAIMIACYHDNSSVGKSTQSYVRIFGLILDIVRENFTMEHFGLVSEYALTGDQPQAICFAH